MRLANLVWDNFVTWHDVGGAAGLAAVANAKFPWPNSFIQEWLREFESI